MFGGDNRNRRAPDGEENGRNLSQQLAKVKQLPQRSHHLNAAGNHVQEDVNLSDDSLEDDGHDLATNINTSRDSERENTHPDSRVVARNSSHSNQHADVLVSNGATSSVHDITHQQHINGDNDKERSAYGSAKSSQISSRASSCRSCASKIPVLKRPKVKPSPLVEASKASLSSAAIVTVVGEHPPPPKQAKDGDDTPVSIPIDETNCLEYPVVPHNREEQAAVTIQAYYRGWSTRKGNRNPQTKLEGKVSVCLCAHTHTH